MPVVLQNTDTNPPETTGSLEHSASTQQHRSTRQRSAEKHDDRPVRLSHLLKTIGLALALTGLFMIPQFLIHIPTGIIAPISAGITTGGIMKVRPVESFIIGLTLFFVITLPAPIAYLWFGFANHLPFIAIFAFSFAFGAYYGTLIGVFSWIGARINQSKIGPGQKA
jgi:hypothetical protein